MAVAALEIEFVMHGARAAMAGGMTHIEAQVKSIERAVIENPGLAFDLARTLVESACRTILTDRRIVFGVDDDLPRLFKTVTADVPMLPITASSEVHARRSLVQTLNGLHTALQGVCELRNAYGFASHGVGGPRPAMESVQALLAAQTADAIVGFLHRVHREERNILPAVRIEYGDSENFNSYIDEANMPVQIFHLTYRPSEVLFVIDSEAYKDILASFESENAETQVVVPSTSPGSAP
jgi:Abortive infection C-terminus